MMTTAPDAREEQQQPRQPVTDHIPPPPEPEGEEPMDDGPDPRDGAKLGDKVGSKPERVDDSLRLALELKAKLDAKRRRLREEGLMGQGGET